MDSYTVAEAARLLEVSPKRVRQLIGEGKLSTLPDSSPMRIAASEVLGERERRDTQGRPATGPAKQSAPPVDLETLLAFARETTRLALEASHADRVALTSAHAQVEATLKEALSEARSRADAAEKRAREAELKLAGQPLKELESPVPEALQEQPRPRAWWRRQGITRRI